MFEVSFEVISVTRTIAPALNLHKGPKMHLCISIWVRFDHKLFTMRFFTVLEIWGKT